MKDFVSILSAAIGAIVIGFVLQDLHGTVMALTLLPALLLQQRTDKMVRELRY